MRSKGNMQIGRRLALLLALIVGALALSSGIALAATITCQSGVDCFGTNNADTLIGTDDPDDIYGRRGADILRGRDQPDNLYGQRGSDTLLGGPGDDLEAPDNTNDALIGGPGNDTLRGGADRDYYHFLNNWGKDTIADSTSNSSLIFQLEDKVVTDDLTIRFNSDDASPEVKNTSGTSTVNWESDTLIQYVLSGEGDDNITGDLLNNIIYGGKGADTISSLSGNDGIFVAGDGYVDTVNCGSGLFGAQDNDFVYYDSSDVVNDNCEQKQLATP
jgi:Ca2+-binding RTX toxin-like protein